MTSIPLFLTCCFSSNFADNKDDNNDDNNKPNIQGGNRPFGNRRLQRINKKTTGPTIHSYIVVSGENNHRSLQNIDEVKDQIDDKEDEVWKRSVSFELYGSSCRTNTGKSNNTCFFALVITDQR